jgi:SAM-dependent methyltransferase
MPTLPPEGVSFTDLGPEQLRRLATSFGEDPERYDRTRPDYPEALVDRVVGAAPGRDVLDVGIGTGIAARQFRAAGCRVLGVEVDERMAAAARRDGFEVEVAPIESWEVAGRGFDVVVAGQTWHWVDPLGGAAKAAEALRPGGRLAVFWNVGQPPPEAAEAFSAVYARVLPGSPWSGPARSALAGYEAAFDRTEDGIRRSGGFAEPERWRFDWSRSYTRAEWLEQVPTFGGHSRFPPETLAELLEGIGEALDALGGSFAMEFAAVAITTTRKSE